MNPTHAVIPQVRDSSGFAIFSDTGVGEAHAVAHRYLDAANYQDGYDALVKWLEGERPGYGARWVHIQWHVVVFELAVGHWARARQRFDAGILPAVLEGDTALTDAPSALWRLSLAAGEACHLPWDPVITRAKSQLGGQPFVELSHLLAFAGGGEPHAIE